ncbi:MULTISPECIES: hypothetical protein [unclassified Methylophaga]|uniref:hypothetical protein n=1 Tax=unclassified Methylophaga TaxID=2629249 RepID=UPI000C98F89E|nr:MULTISPECIES: hypothetical protein [unclassified Methylophaga]MBN46302.1 hypothetical protein [Methylophaga sp.]|tara:strand:- start:48395 stop:48748 length:354 start_codon:yes stop_codon:yes gene_type:complete
MGLLDDIRDDIHVNFLDEADFASQLVYQPLNGTSTTIPYMPLSSMDDEVDESDGVWRIRQMQLLISSDPVKGIVKPDVVDVVTINSEVWALTRFQSDTISCHTITVERRELIKKTRR